MVSPSTQSFVVGKYSKADRSASILSIAGNEHGFRTGTCRPCRPADISGTPEMTLFSDPNVNVSGQQSAVLAGIGRWLLAFNESQTALLSLHGDLEQIAGTGTTNVTTEVRIL